jgi:hypothetical protein
VKEPVRDDQDQFGADALRDALRNLEQESADSYHTRDFLVELAIAFEIIRRGYETLKESEGDSAQLRVVRDQLLRRIRQIH